MQEQKDKSIGELVEDARNYIDARLEYGRLYLVEQGVKVFADLVTSTVVVVCFILAFLFGSVTLALFLSNVFDSYTAGFGCVSLIYLILAVIVFLTKDKYIEKAIINSAIKRYFEKLGDKEEVDEKL